MTLAEAAAQPLTAAAHASKGRPLVGLLGGGAPLEVVLASGCVAVAIPPLAAVPLPLASRYLGSGAAVALAGRLERLLQGELTSLALALMTSRHELDAFLHHSAKEVLRRGEGAMLPALHLHVLLGDPLPAARDYSLEQARRLANRLAAVSGEPVSTDRLLEAVTELNRLRNAAARLQALRFTGQVSGADAVTAIAAARSLPPIVATAALITALDETTGCAPVDAPRLLLMSSGELFHRELHVALEDAGGRVVLEDGDWGARAFGPEITPEPGEPPMEAVVRSYRAHTPGLAVYPHTRRHAWFYEQAARPEVDAIVFHVPLDEAALGWDHPRLSAYAEQVGKPALLVRADPLDAKGRDEITDQARAFLDQLAERRG